MCRHDAVQLTSKTKRCRHLRPFLSTVGVVSACGRTGSQAVFDVNSRFSFYLPCLPHHITRLALLPSATTKPGNPFLSLSLRAAAWCPWVDIYYSVGDGMDASNVFPAVRECRLGRVVLDCPRDPVTVLEAKYGSDWHQPSQVAADSREVHFSKLTALVSSLVRG